MLGRHVYRVHLGDGEEQRRAHDEVGEQDLHLQRSGEPARAGRGPRAAGRASPAGMIDGLNMIASNRRRAVARRANHEDLAR